MKFSLENNNVEEVRDKSNLNLWSEAFDGFFCTWGATSTRSSFFSSSILRRWLGARYARKHLLSSLAFIFSS
jgi:hypothetical protein